MLFANTTNESLDALSLKEGDGTYTISGGGAQGAQDKVIQVGVFWESD